MTARLIPQIVNWNAYRLMMTSPTHQPRHLLSAWGLSFCIHATVLAGALAFLHELPRLEPPVYRIEFLLTDPKSAADAATSQEATTVTEPPSPAAPSSSRTTSTSSTHVIEQHPLTETSIVQPTANPVTPAAVEQREMSPSATAIDSTPVANPTPIEQPVEILLPVIESRRPATMNSPQAVERPFMTTPPQVAASPAEPIAKSLHDGAAYPAHAASEISQNAAQTASMTSSNLPSSLSSSDEHSPSSQPTGQSSITASQAASQTADSSSPPSQMDSGSPATTPQQTLVMNHPPITRTIPSRPDYGWLTDSLRRRVESLKAYPRLARVQGWEGRVVVRATIKDDGSLLDVQVVESSGYEALDDDALRLMKRVCPIRLQHELGQPHVAVVVPIQYRLEP
jgi:protein TonB